MHFQPYHIYHVFNQGNNKELIFFEEENYRFFLKKMRKHLLPHVHLLAYCLMPNHFHWLICAKPSGCQLSTMIKPSRFGQILEDEQRYQQNLSASIAVILRSYTRAINVQRNRSGSLFRQKTKAENGDVNYSVQLPQLTKRIPRMQSFPNIEFIKADYWQTCFDYIHQNPVKAELVTEETFWPFSSATDYTFDTMFSLCDVELSRHIGLAA